MTSLMNLIKKLLKNLSRFQYLCCVDKLHLLLTFFNFVCSMFSVRLCVQCSVFVLCVQCSVFVLTKTLGGFCGKEVCGYNLI